MTWEAEQEPIGRRVAIKLCPVGSDLDAEDVARFRRGALAMARMTHPHIVTVHDFGEWQGPEGPELFLVMERIEGVPLTRFLARGALPPARAQLAASQVLRALGHVHGHGYVHRDVKPANLAAMPIDDDPFVVKLLDFGIARPIDATLKPEVVVASERRRGSRVTQPLRILGTPDYMAPEQILDLALDARTDLYAAAIVLWQLVAGRPTYIHDDRRELYAAHLRAPVPRFASVLPPGTLSDCAPWQEFFERALAKSAGKRFESAAEMRQALLALPL
ncbi:MAG: serine/threonine protein kinase [Deltaproteobacteria bacterium]|nr:serine/threonine protein kinase [Deltaproteobacteria bacterium]